MILSKLSYKSYCCRSVMPFLVVSNLALCEGAFDITGEGNVQWRQTAGLCFQWKCSIILELKLPAWNQSTGQQLSSASCMLATTKDVIEEQKVVFQPQSQSQSFLKNQSQFSLTSSCIVVVAPLVIHNKSSSSPLLQPLITLSISLSNLLKELRDTSIIALNNLLNTSTSGLKLSPLRW